MNIYLLERRGEDWRVGEARGFVVVAAGPATASLLASGQAGDEGPEVWLDPERSTCEQLGVMDGGGGLSQQARVVLRDYYGD